MTNPNFMNGVPELLILRLLEQREMYGYELVQAIHAATTGAISLGEGVVYPQLHALEREGALKSRRKSVNGRTRVCYTVTARGTKRLTGLAAQWNRIAQVLGQVMKEASHGPQRFDRLRERLLRAGIAPRHVRRYIGELSDHLDDLVREETAKGLNESLADAQARTRLGGDDTLAQALMARPGLRSFTARYPLATFGFGPVVLLAIILFAGILTEGEFLYLHFALVRASGVLHPAPPDWLKLSVAAWNGVLMYAAPLVVAALLCRIGLTQRMSGAWIVFGLAVICIVGGFHDVGVKWSDAPAQRSVLDFSFLLMPPYARSMILFGLVRAGTNIALAAAAYFLWLRRGVSVVPEGS